MLWNQYSSDNMYDSISDHALMIGCLSKKIIDDDVYSKIFIVCSRAQQNGDEQSEHFCSKHYEGSSKVMETDTVLHLYKRLYNTSNKMLTLKVIVTDDNSTMRAVILQGCNKKKGKLPSDIPCKKY